MKIDFDFKLPESVDSYYVSLDGLSINSVRFLRAFAQQYCDYLNKRGNLSRDELRFMNSLRLFLSCSY